jgi:hypothetical protein
METKEVMSKAMRRRGAAMAILVVIIVLGGLVFILQKAGLLQRGIPDPNTEGIMPWTEWEARQKLASEDETETSSELFAKSLNYDGNLDVAGTDEPRGELQLFTGGGDVRGMWYGGYYNKRTMRQYELMNGDFSGKFYPGKKYVDENGNEDLSKQYFLCMGKFLMQETGEKIVRGIGGDIYVRGWVDDANMIDGKVFITSDNKNFHEFEFSGRGK